MKLNDSLSQKSEGMRNAGGFYNGLNVFLSINCFCELCKQRKLIISHIWGERTN